MKLGKTMKKLSAIIMAFAMIFSVMGICGNDITAKAASNPVKMYSSEITFSKYGITRYNVYIQIDANSASNKKVYVHHSTYDQGWVDEEATFVAKTDSNTEIWKASVSGIQSENYAIKYVGDGVTYWDNNNGKDYYANDAVGTAVVKAVPGNPYIDIGVVVKNLAYNKEIKVRYTTDNWATYKEANLSYYRSSTDGSMEYWTTDIDGDDSDGFQYCISYTVNGKTYWDNNFGQNYNGSFYRPY